MSHLGTGVDLIIFGLIIILMMVRQPRGIMGILSGVRKYIGSRWHKEAK